MRTSYVTLCLFWGAVFLAILSQIGNYWSTPKANRTALRKGALALALCAAVCSGVAGWRASIDWASLPDNDGGLAPGQIWNNGGVPAIVR